MTRKYHNHLLQANRRHREEELQNTKSHDIRKTIKVKQSALSSTGRPRLGSLASSIRILAGMVAVAMYQDMQGDKRLVSEHINPFKPNEMSRFYQLDQFISILSGVGWYFF